MLDDGKKFDSTIFAKQGTMEYKICGINFCNYAVLTLLILIGDRKCNKKLHMYMHFHIYMLKIL